jgi:hypothetical protein
MVARRGEPNKVDEAFISPCNEFGISPLMNERRMNLRTVSASTRARLETQVDERHGRALTQSQEEVRELQTKLEEERYAHLLAKEAVVLRAKNQKRKDKEAFAQAQDKQDKLHDLVAVAELSRKDLERWLRVESTEAGKAVQRCERLEEARQSDNMELQAQSGALEDTNAKYREADKELRSLRTEVKNLNKELRRKGDDITALRTMATQLETTWKKKVANAEGREKKLKVEAKENESRMERLVEAGKNDNLELRNTINRLANEVDTLQQEATQQKKRAVRRELKWELQLNQAKKDHVKAESERETLEDTLEELNEQRRQRIEVRETGRRGNPVNDKFTRHVRALLASGASAAATLKQLSLNARLFLNDEDYNHFVLDLPRIRWFQYQREGLGLESYLYTLTRIAKSDRILQWGFDETSLDGVATLNQWVRIKEGADLHIVTLECAGLLVGSTASKVAEHVRLNWHRGQEAIAMLRAELGELADEYVPLSMEALPCQNWVVSCTIPVIVPIP